MDENRQKDIFAEKLIEIKNSWFNPDAIYNPRNADIELTKDSEIYQNHKVLKNTQSISINKNNYQVSIDNDNIRVTNYDKIDDEISQAKNEIRERYNLFFQNYWNNNQTKYNINTIDSLNINSSNNLNYILTKNSQKISPNSINQKYELSPIDTKNTYISNDELGSAAWQGENTGNYLNEMRNASYEAFVMGSENNLYLTYGQAANKLIGSGLSTSIMSTVLGNVKDLIRSGRVNDMFADLGVSLSNSTVTLFNVGKTDNAVTGEVKGETHYSQRLLYGAASNMSLMNSIVNLANGNTTAAGVSLLGAIASTTGYNLGVTSFFAMYPNNAEAWSRTIRLMMFIDSPVFGTRIDRTRSEWDINYSDTIIDSSTGNEFIDDKINRLSKASLKNQGFISNPYDADYNQLNENEDILKYEPKTRIGETEIDLGELNPGPYKIYGEQLSQNLISGFISDKNKRYNTKNSNRENDWLFRKSKDNSFGPSTLSVIKSIKDLGKRPKDNNFNVYFNLIELVGTTDIKLKNRVDLPPTITDFKDPTTPTWNEVEYTGRPTTGNVYTGFKRTISFSFHLVGDSPANHKKMFETISFFENASRPNGFSYLSGMTGNILLFNMSNLVVDNIVIIESFEKDIEGPWHLTSGMPLVYKCSITLKVLYDGAIESGFMDDRPYGHDRYPSFIGNPLSDRYLETKTDTKDDTNNSPTDNEGVSRNYIDDDQTFVNDPSFLR